MVRKIIKIDDEKCNGCGLCAEACHEGAIGMVDGKAKLLRDDYCDGLGNCLPVCPTGAISFEEREAADFDEDAVKANIQQKQQPAFQGCPGQMARSIEQTKVDVPQDSTITPAVKSRLMQWPVQIKLVPVNAPYFDGAKLLVAADCTAYSYAGFHEDFMKGHVTLIGCPKLDEGDYAEKLTAIIKNNDIKSVAIARMSVPCCGGLEHAVKTALQQSGKMIPWQVVTFSPDGEILDR